LWAGGESHTEAEKHRFRWAPSFDLVLRSLLLVFSSLLSPPLFSLRSRQKEVGAPGRNSATVEMWSISVAISPILFLLFFFLPSSPCRDPQLDLEDHRILNLVAGTITGRWGGGRRVLPASNRFPSLSSLSFLFFCARSGRCRSVRRRRSKDARSRFDPRGRGQIKKESSSSQSGGRSGSSTPLLPFSYSWSELSEEDRRDVKYVKDR